MTYKLNTDTLKVKYTDFENEVFNHIPQDGSKIITHDLVKAIYGEEKPYHAQGYISSAVRGLSKKTAYNKETFRVRRSKPAGCKPLEVWIEQVP